MVPVASAKAVRFKSQLSDKKEKKSVSSTLGIFCFFFLCFSASPAGPIEPTLS